MFKITITKQEELGELDSEDTTLSEAVDSTYTPLDLRRGAILPNFKWGDILLHWNQISMPLLFSCMSDIVDDILRMLDAILNGDNSDITFLTEPFTVFWYFEIQDSMIKIVSKWGSISADEQTREILNSDKSVLIIDKKIFIQEWFKLLSIFHNDLKTVGYDFPEFNDKLAAYAAFLQE